MAGLTQIGLILLAAGNGTRMRGQVADKALAVLAGSASYGWSLRSCCAGLTSTEAGSAIALRVVTVYRDPAQKEALSALFHEGITVAARGNRFEASCHLPAEVRDHWSLGGRTRPESVLRGLEQLDIPGESIVLIHDVARPAIHPDTVRDVYLAARKCGAACAAHRAVDTLHQVPADYDATTDPVMLTPLDRRSLWALETPQAFRLDWIHEAYRDAMFDQALLTDDASAAAHAGHPVRLIENPYSNPKLTHPDDLGLLDRLLRQRLGN